MFELIEACALVCKLYVQQFLLSESTSLYLEKGSKKADMKSLDLEMPAN